MDDKATVFRTCRNYKRGIYVFNLYKKSDFIVLLVAVSLGLFILFVGFSDIETAKTSSYLAMFVIGIPVFLTLPLKGYHAMYYRLYYLLKYLFRIRFYVWGGRKFLFEEDGNEAV